MTIRQPNADYADVTGGPTPGEPAGTSYLPPNAFTTIQDALSVITRLEGTAPGLRRAWADMDGNSVITIIDIHRIILAMEGMTYSVQKRGEVPGSDSGTNCRTSDNTCIEGAPAPLGGGTMQMLAGGLSMPLTTTSTFVLVPDLEFIDPGDLVNVDVFIDTVSDLGAFGVELAASGGDAGTLTLESVTIDSIRTDFAFYGESIMPMSNLAGARVGAIVQGVGGVAITTPAYLATFSYRASMDAVGGFSINVVDPFDSFLSNSLAQVVESSFGDGTGIGVDVACFLDSQCDDSVDCTDDVCTSGVCVNTNDDTNACTDGNDCTDDVCTAGVCVSTNDDTNACTDETECTDDSCSSGVCVSVQSAQGTACDDGLFCSAFDQCDASGACVGALQRCPARWICDEWHDVCLPPLSPN